MNFYKKLLSSVILSLCIITNAYPQQSPGRQSYNFQYLTGVMTRAQITTSVAAAFNSAFLPKYYSMGVTTTASGFVVALQGSLDNVNWSTLGTTNSVLGVASFSIPKPMLFFRMQATTLAANTSVTGTAVGTQ